MIFNNKKMLFLSLLIIITSLIGYFFYQFLTPSSPVYAIFSDQQAPKITVEPFDESLNDKTYVLETERWNISDNGTNADNTTTGFNNALQWASQEGFTVFK